MKITYELDLNSFEAWSGGEDTLNRVINEGKVDELEAVLEECYPEGMDETSLNDILRFESDWVFEMCEIRSESVIREELEEAEAELEEILQDYEFALDDDDLTDEEKVEVYNAYKDDIQEAKEKITELEEELENI